MAKWIDVRRWRRSALVSLACLVAAVGAVALAAGCGDSGGAANGPARTVVQVQHLATDRWTYARERFREQCAGCHTLADARANGRRFNLDHDGNITPDRARYAIKNGEPGMPAWGDTLTRREFEELVAYVSTVERQTPGETNWSWQARLRMAGQQWRPGDSRVASEAAAK
ncbi:MAG TPA: cytochrome c [Conexibacter sp.]|jgi:mono/diheme cytochrome c family protein|nr:cytochrome c [Conexibacter sp.]